MSGFGLTATTSAPTAPAATTRFDDGATTNPNGPEGTTASQFAAMLVALLGGPDARPIAPDRPAELMRPIARLEDEDGVSEQEAADALRYGILVEDMQPIAPILPPDLPPIQLLPEMYALPDTPTSPVGTPTRDLDGLTPEFRTRLERVITRMREEFGHDVQLVETTRSPERQEWLFAQGRTRPGPVVTWTRNSAHLTGDAADVMIDGQWRNDAAYGRLHRIAEEEGLRTLGARDPGHLELPAAARQASMITLAERAAAVQANGHAHSNASDVARAAVARATARQARLRGEGNPLATRDHAPATGTTAADAMPTPDLPLPSTNSMASAPRVAAAAPVAAVANVASVATTAAVARPGAVSTRAVDGERVASDLTLAEKGGRSSRRSRDRDEPTMPLSSTAATTAFRASATTDAPTSLASAAVDRVDQVNGIAARSPREVAQLTLALDTGDGRRDEVTVGVRGAQVGANIVTNDAGTADRLRDNVIDLRRALEARGLGVDEFRAEVRRGTETTDPARVLAATDRDALRVRTGSESGDAFLSRDQDGRGRQDAERRADREGRQPGDERHPFTGQEQRERQQAAREQAARLAAFRRLGALTYGDDAA